jgi:hypothetical protein
MTSLETSYTKNVTNELSFLMVTDTTHFDIRFGSDSLLDRLWTDWAAGVWLGLWDTSLVRLTRV